MNLQTGVEPHIVLGGDTVFVWEDVNGVQGCWCSSPSGFFNRIDLSRGLGKDAVFCVSMGIMYSP
jgi:hypothetical protein